MHETPPLLLTSEQAAKAMAVSARTLWSLSDRGEIPTVRIGRAVRYSPADLAAWIDQNKSTGAEAK